MISYEFAITQFFGEEYIDDGTNDLKYQCPKCKELGKRCDDYKLWVNKYTLVFHCFRCDWKGRISTEEVLDESSSNKLIEYLRSIRVGEEEVEEELPSYYKIPKTLLTRESNERAYKYIKSRNVSDEDIIKYSMRVSTLEDDVPMIGRIVIPNKVIANQYTDMYVARTYIEQIPKYKNPYDSPKDNIVFNLQNIPYNPESLIINEGVITSIVAGSDSVATYGKSVSDKQIDLIALKNPKKLYVSLDNDAEDDNSLDVTHYKITKCIDRLLRKLHNTEIYFVRMPAGRDAVDLGREVYRERYLSSAVRIKGLKFFKMYIKIHFLSHN